MKNSILQPLPWGQRVCFVGIFNFGKTEILFWSKSRNLSEGLFASELCEQSDYFTEVCCDPEIYLKIGMFFTWQIDGAFEVDRSGYEQWLQENNEAESFGWFTTNAFPVDPDSPPCLHTQAIPELGEVAMHGFRPEEQ